MQILSATDGTKRYAGPWASTWNPPRLLLDRGDAFWYLGVNMGSRPTSHVVAIDAATGKERWRSAALPGGAYEAGGAMVASADRLYVCTAGGLLRVLSRSDGKELANVGVGECEQLKLLGERLVASSYRGLVLVEQSAFASAEHAVSLQGRVTLSPDALLRVYPPFTVSLGGRYAKTDASGRFHEKLRGRGILNVDVSLSERERRLELLSRNPTYVTLAEQAPPAAKLEIKRILE